MRSLDLSELTKPELGWQMLRTEGKPPNAVVGMATAVWDGRGAILCSGGKAANGKVHAHTLPRERRGCNSVWQRLQPYVAEAATLRGRGCNPAWQRLQPYVAEAATLRDRGCNPM